MKLAAFMIDKDGKIYTACGQCEHCGNRETYESHVPWTEGEARKMIEGERCPICGRGASPEPERIPK